MILNFKDFILERYSLDKVESVIDSTARRTGLKLLNQGYDYLGTITMEYSGDQSRDEKIMNVIPEEIFSVLANKTIPDIIKTDNQDNSKLYEVLEHQELETVKSFSGNVYDYDYTFLLENKKNNYFYFLKPDRESNEFATWFIDTRTRGIETTLKEFRFDYSKKFIKPDELDTTDYYELMKKTNNYKNLGIVEFRKKSMGNVESLFIPDDIYTDYKSIIPVLNEPIADIYTDNYKWIKEITKDPRNVESVYKCERNDRLHGIYYVLVNDTKQYYYLLKDNQDIKSFIKLVINLRVQGRNKVERKLETL